MGGMDLHGLSLPECVSCFTQRAEGLLSGCNPLGKRLYFTQPSAACYHCELVEAEVGMISGSRCDLRSTNVVMQELLASITKVALFYVGVSMLTRKKLRNHPYGIWGFFFFMWSGFTYNGECVELYQLLARQGIIKWMTFLPAISNNYCV